MMNRGTISLWATLLLVSSTFAQPAQLPPSPSLPPLVDEPTPLMVPNGAGPPVDKNFWASAEYLASWIRGTGLPPLVTTSPSGTAQASSGIPGPNTTTLFGGTVNNDYRSGFRLGTGYWFNSQHTLGIEAGFMMIEGQSTTFSASSDGTQILARPFTDATTNLAQAVLVAFPTLSSGSIAIRASNANLYEAHLDLTEKALDCGWFRLNSLLGYRYLSYANNITIQQTRFPFTSVGAIPGTQIVSVDDFRARNDFHGLDMGFRGQVLWQNFSLDLLGKVAVGNLTRQVNITGSQVTTTPGLADVSLPGGVLALGSNMGQRSSNIWTAVPELGTTLNWYVRPNLALNVGYSILLLTQTANAGDQIDTRINPALFPPPTQFPGVPNRPAFSFHHADTWVQSISVGLVFTY